MARTGPTEPITSIVHDGVDGETFRATLARWASGVTILTCRDGEEPVGMTASSFSSLSLDPPLVLACIGNRSQAHDALVGASGFAVHLLSREQEDLSGAFARPGPEKFAATGDVRGPFEAPLLPLGVARLVCAHEAALPGGDHTILVGRVVAAEHTEAPQLLYADRGYRGLDDGG
jgi:flavin reductase (DIM6/NTAB) family NADH-FMN oxidoreductase RutF